MDDEDIEPGKPTLSTLAAWNGVDITNLAVEAGLSPLRVWDYIYGHKMSVVMLYELVQALNRLKDAHYTMCDISR